MIIQSLNFIIIIIAIVNNNSDRFRKPDLLTNLVKMANFQNQFEIAVWKETKARTAYTRVVVPDVQHFSLKLMTFICKLTIMRSTHNLDSYFNELMVL